MTISGLNWTKASVHAKNQNNIETKTKSKKNEHRHLTGKRTCAQDQSNALLTLFFSSRWWWCCHFHILFAICNLRFSLSCTNTFMHIRSIHIESEKFELRSANTEKEPGNILSIDWLSRLHLTVQNRYSSCHFSHHANMHSTIDTNAHTFVWLRFQCM